jgi:hypothetical protein
LLAKQSLGWDKLSTAPSRAPAIFQTMSEESPGEIVQTASAECGRPDRQGEGDMCGPSSREGWFPHRSLAGTRQNARRVVDPNNTGVEEADPYALAPAVHLKRLGHDVTVLTEETKNRPDKLSMNTACGLLRLWCLAIEPFLVERGMWTRGG